MLISMTGFGQGEATDGRYTVTSEVRTVNHRFLDCSIKLPRNLQLRERDVRDQVRAKASRGRIYVTVTLDDTGDAAEVTINEALMRQYLDRLRGFAQSNGVNDDVTLSTLVSLPDVFGANNNDANDEVLWPLLNKSLNDALDKLVEMRSTEGKTIHKDLSERLAAIASTVAEIEKVAPEVNERHARTYRERIDKLMSDSKIDTDRLMTEVSLLAERLDFTEEVTRLKSHIEQFDHYMNIGGEVAKRLTYLLQEMHREASTIGSKASDTEVIQHVVSLKEETEKIREQVQNVE